MKIALPPHGKLEVTDIHFPVLYSKHKFPSNMLKHLQPLVLTVISILYKAIITMNYKLSPCFPQAVYILYRTYCLYELHCIYTW